MRVIECLQVLIAIGYKTLGINEKVYGRKVDMKKLIISILISIVTLLVIIVGIKIYINNTNHILVYSDVSDYEKYRSGENADKNFKSKFAMDESIWPEKITESMEVKDYKIQKEYHPKDKTFNDKISIYHFNGKKVDKSF